MADSTHTSAYQLDYQDALKGLIALNTQTLTLAETERISRKALDDSNKALATARERMASMRVEAHNGVAVLEEQATQLQAMTDNLVEWGATQATVSEHQERALAQFEKSNKAGMAYVQTVKYLSDASDGLTISQMDIQRSLELARAAGIKAEDAARQYGEAMLGNADVLRRFDKIAQDAADAIEQISDPQLRAAATSKALEQAMQRQASVVTRVQDRYRAFIATHPGLVRGLKLVAAGTKTLTLGLGGLAGMLAGGAGAVGGGVLAAMKSYVNSNAQLKREYDEVVGRGKHLVTQLGKIAFNAISGRKGLDKLNDGMGKLFKLANKNRVAIADGIRATVQSLVEIARAGLKVVNGVIVVTANMYDALRAKLKGVADFIAKILTLAADERLDVLFYQLGMEHGPREEMKRSLKTQAAGLRGAIPTGPSLTFENRVAMAQAEKAFDDALKGFADHLAAQMGKDPGKLDRYKGPKGSGKGEGSDDIKAAREAMSEGALTAFGRAQDDALRAEEEFQARLKKIRKQAQSNQPLVDAAVAYTDAVFESQLEYIRLLQAGYVDLGGTLEDFTSGALDGTLSGLEAMGAAWAQNESMMDAFGKTLLASMGSTLVQMGRGLVLMGLGAQQIQSGLISPAAAIAIGSGMILAGGAMKGAASGFGSGGGGGSGSEAAAIQSGFRTATEQVLGQQSALENLTVNLAVDGFEQMTVRTLNRAMDNRLVTLPT